MVTRFTTTNIAATPDWPASRQLSAVARLLIRSQTFSHIAGGNTATPYFRPLLPHELEFATDTDVSRDIVASDAAFAFSYSVGVPKEGSFAAVYPARTYPCQRFVAFLAEGHA
jgi:hypothetical protein